MQNSQSILFTHNYLRHIKRKFTCSACSRLRSRRVERRVDYTASAVEPKILSENSHLIKSLKDESSYPENISEKLETKELLNSSLTVMGNEGLYPHDVWHSDPYEKVPKLKHKTIQELSKRLLIPPGVSVGNTTVLLFPGQGTQFIGMGEKLLKYPNVKEMYETASSILDYDILKLSCEGPAEKLNRTKYQQPAILLASLAAVEKLRYEDPSVLESCVAAAGYSIGEITALTFARAFTFENAVRIVKARAEAMDLASQVQPSGMMTVFFGHQARVGLACKLAAEMCRRKGMQQVDCRVAGYLYPHCKVVAGNEMALKFIELNKEDFGIRKTKRLNVSGAFHTDLMKPAAFVLSEVLKEAPISKTSIPVYSNVYAEPFKNPTQIRTILAKQIHSAVRWEQIMHIIGDRKDLPRVFEVGPGQSLKTILKQVNIKAFSRCESVEV